MLTGTAYTLRNRARLAISLALIGGFIDAVGFLLLNRVFTSNMTGNTATAAVKLAAGQWHAAAFFAFVILMFFSGAALSGLLTIGGTRKGLKSVYALALSVELLLLSLYLLFSRWAMLYLADQATAVNWRGWVIVALPALAMGLQNATITQIAGSVVRTTHVTGVVTDLGLESIQFLFFIHDQSKGPLLTRLRHAYTLSRKHPSLQRLFLLASIWCSFLAGATLGCVGYAHFDVTSLVLPISFLAFMIILDLLHPIADVHQVDHRLHDDDLKRFGIDPGLLPATVGVYRIRGKGRRRRRAPDLGKLPERISPDTRVALLMLDRVNLDDNHLAGLQAAAQALRERHCHLILCILESELFVRLLNHPILHLLDAANLCSDIEFAVARALELSSSPDNLSKRSVALPTE